MLRFPARSKTLIIQNAVAAFVFAIAFSGNLAAYLLHAFPSSEALWRISVPLNRAAQPITRAIDALSAHPAMSLALLCSALAIAFASYRSRSWIGTAVVGHAALGACVMMTLSVADERLSRNFTADNIWYINPAYMNDRVIGLGAIAAIMLVFCALNHAAFFRIKAKTAPV